MNTGTATIRLKLALSALTIAILTSGCSTTWKAGFYDTEGDVIMTNSEVETYDYKISYKYIWGLERGGEEENQRLEFVQFKMQNVCETYHIVEQEPIKQGKNVFGKDLVIWIVKVKCA